MESEYSTGIAVAFSGRGWLYRQQGNSLTGRRRNSLRSMGLEIHGARESTSPASGKSVLWQNHRPQIGLECSHRGIWPVATAVPSTYGFRLGLASLWQLDLPRADSSRGAAIFIGTRFLTGVHGRQIDQRFGRERLLFEQRRIRDTGCL